MGVLSDKEIRYLCLPAIPPEGFKPMLEPFSEGVQGDNTISYGLTSAGYDLRLGHKVMVFKNTTNAIMDPKDFKRGGVEYQNRLFDVLDNLKAGERVILPAHSYLLAYSLEYIRMPRHLKATCVGKSSYARAGVLINTTPIEPMWRGHLTLEIGNISPCPIALHVAEGIAQIEFHLIYGEVEKDYENKHPGGGKYQDQGPEPIPSRVL